MQKSSKSDFLKISLNILNVFSYWLRINNQLEYQFELMK